MNESRATKIERMVEESREARARFWATETPAVIAAAERIIEAMRQGGKLLICGNGGSAADAQHMAAELAFRMGRERRALPALALTTDTSLLTAISNDRSFDFVFARQLEAIGRPGDIALLISTSGNSPNILEAARAARSIGVATIGLLGAGGGRVASEVDHALIVPHEETPRIQEVHLMIEHILCQLIEDDLCPAD
jgi:D-sedoheptulose 7-phosphate isomerase